MSFNLTFSDFLVLLGHVALYIYLFFGVYVLVMGLYRAHLNKTLTIPGYVLGGPWLVIGYAMDVVANLTLFTVLFVELPRELLVTSRLRRHLKEVSSPQSWRWRVSHQICSKLLDYFDPRDSHCT